MAADVPTRVVYYTRFRRPVWESAAEFRYDPEAGGISLRIIDAEMAGGAQRSYDRGADSYAEGRFVPHTEAEAFMRALVEPNITSRVRYVDRSNCDPATDADIPEEGSHGYVVDIREGDL